MAIGNAFNNTLTNPLITTNGGIDVTAAGTLTIGASVGANNLTLGGATSTVVIDGDLNLNIGDAATSGRVYFGADDYISLDSSAIATAIGGLTKFSIAATSTTFLGSDLQSSNTAGGRLRVSSSSMTAPYVLRKGDTNTGVGGDGTDGLALISNAKTALAVTDATTANNIELFGSGGSMGDTTPGDGVLRINAVKTVPVGAVTGGGLIYVSGNDIRFLAADATDSTMIAAGGGDVTKVGTPVNNQVGVWTGDGTIEGTAGLTYDGANLQLTGDIGSTGTRITKGWFVDLTVTNAITGSITGNAATVSTIAGLAPNTATTASAQPNITSLGDLSSLTMDGDINAGGNLITNVDSISLGSIVYASPASDHRAAGPTMAFLNAGYTSAIGDLVYLNGSGQWVQADADAVATAGGVMLGIALAVATSGNPLNVALAGSLVRDDTWAWTVGAELYVSLTAGSITEGDTWATDDVIRVIGYAVSADVIYFNPSSSWITHA